MCPRRGRRRHVKASFLAAVAHGEPSVAPDQQAKATELHRSALRWAGNVQPLIERSTTLKSPASPQGPPEDPLMFDFFNDVAAKATAGKCQGPGSDEELG